MVLISLNTWGFKRKSALCLNCLFLLIIAVPILAHSSQTECKTQQDKMQKCVEKSYYPNGNLIFEMPYQNNKREGMGRWYDENGNLEYECLYINDQQQGIAKSYYENGNLWSETSYKDGKQEGREKYFYKNQKPMWEIHYKNGKREGIGKWYNQNGILMAELTYANDELILGKCANGTPLSKTQLHKIKSKLQELDLICPY